MKDLEERIRQFAHWMFESKYFVVFTGAGNSTESGLPDFRGPDGIWITQEEGQNADNLHLRSRIRPELLAELHGNVSKLRCKRCQTQMDKSLGVDICKCGGRLVSILRILSAIQVIVTFLLWWVRVLWSALPMICPESPSDQEPGWSSSIRGDPMDRSCHLRFEEMIGEVLSLAVKKPKRADEESITTPSEEGTGRAAGSPMAVGVPCRMSEWEEL